MTQYTLITGCSGAGKSTLINALAARKFPIVAEPGLRVLRAAQKSGDAALPWRDMDAFLSRVLVLARADISGLQAGSGPVFFDRGLLDAAVASNDLRGVPVWQTLGGVWPYGRRVFLAAPWQGIFQQTPERRHSFDEAVLEYQRIKLALAHMPCTVVELPMAPVSERAAFVERHLAAIPPNPDP